MHIYEIDPCIDTIAVETPCAACIGFFDGFHVGHRQLVNKAVELAKSKGIPSAVITFDPDPWVVLKGMKEVPHITTITQRRQIAESLGIDIWYQIRFTKELASFAPDVFVKKVIEPLQVQQLVCGFDYTYGAFGKGTATDLLTYTTFQTHVIEPITYKNEKISSTRIEQLITNGEMEEVEKILAQPFTMISKVVHGHRIGHTIGFPTLNLDVENVYVLPKNGVYAGYMYHQNTCYLAMINVGKNPTFHKEHKTTVEAHILDFDKDLYDQEITLEFKHFLREEKGFACSEELIQQLQQDVIAVKEKLKIA